MPITAVYKDGVFKPLDRIDLPDETTVRIEVIEAKRTAVTEEWSLHLVEWVAEDFDSAACGFERDT